MFTPRNIIDLWWRIRILLCMAGVPGVTFVVSHELTRRLLGV